LRKAAINNYVEGVHNNLWCLCFAQASSWTRARESECLSAPTVEAEGKLIVHELLADKHKDKEVKGIRLEWAARGHRNE